MLIYNLRIKANSKNSEILFTIGNHDYYTVINGKNFDNGYINDYIHDNVDNFFSSNGLDNWSNRRVDILIPFYKLSPYLYLHLVDDKIVFTHAGLIALNKTDNKLYPIELDKLNQIQNRINREGIELLIGDKWAEENPNLYNVILTREYAEYGVNDEGNENKILRDNICNTITNAGLNLLVVGHCPTIINGIRERIELDKIINENGIYKNCDIGNYLNDDSTKGCLFIDCKDNNGIPRLIFIDTGSSLAFRSTSKSNDITKQYEHIEQNKLRGVEILKLAHSDTIPSPRHFNIMHRFVLFEKNNPEQINIL